MADFFHNWPNQFMQGTRQKLALSTEPLITYSKTAKILKYGYSV